MKEDEDVHRVEVVRELSFKQPFGLEFLPEQLVKRNLQDGFAFNLLCVGETGIGKSSLLCSLFDIKIDSTPRPHFNPTVSLKSTAYSILEKGVRLKLTVVETVGYGDQINRENNVDPILKYIDSQFEKYLQAELKIKRSLATCTDTRIHACLYFIAPTGHTLKSSDLVCLEKIAEKVNVIPVIAKADTLTKDELRIFKESIRGELDFENVELYHFPSDDEVLADMNSEMNNLMPFAVVASVDVSPGGDCAHKIREYPWGTILIENSDHSDFWKLRQALIGNSIEDLKEVTHSKHYERYRSQKLEKIGMFEAGREVDLLQTLKAKREAMLVEFVEKDLEMKQKLLYKVAKVEQELEDQERAMVTKFDHMNSLLELEKLTLEESDKELDEEIRIWRSSFPEANFIRN